MGASQSRIQLPAGLATAVGALPQFSASVASRLISDLMPWLPSGPTVNLEAEAHVDGGDPAALDALSEFLHDLRGRVEPIVLSLVGPVTIDLRLRSDGVDHQHAASEAVKQVNATANQVVDLAAEILPDAPVVLFLEEPSLANSMHPTFPLRPAEIEALITSVVQPLSEQVMVGIQVAGRADWAMLMRTGISILGAPITASLESAAHEISQFLAQGGFIAWGAVPLNEPLGSNSDRQWKRLSGVWGELAKLGLDPVLLRERSIITPAAHLGNFGLSQAERVLSITADLSGRVLNQVLGAQLPAGA